MSLYGGGFWIAFSQACIVYYGAAVMLHYVVPTLLPVRTVQKGNRSKGQVSREIFNSLGEIYYCTSILPPPSPAANPNGDAF